MTYLPPLFVVSPGREGGGGAPRGGLWRGWLTAHTGAGERPSGRVWPISGRETLTRDGANLNEWTTESCYWNGGKVTQ